MTSITKQVKHKMESRYIERKENFLEITLLHTAGFVGNAFAQGSWSSAQLVEQKLM